MTFLTVMISMAVAAAVASPVEERVARQVAVKFWNTYRPSDVPSADNMRLLTVSYLQHQYIFSNGERGFVVVSADDRVRPVLGYSFTTSASAEPNPEVRYWLLGFERQLAAWDDVEGGQPDPQWAKLLDNPVPPEPLSLSNVPPLCHTEWDQGEPFNSLCPWDSVHGGRTVVGCVATAMAQVMKRWNHPWNGNGSHTYDYAFQDDATGAYSQVSPSADFGKTTYLWDDMPNTLPNLLGVPETRGSRAVSTLSYHCGVAVDMMYGVSKLGGSGAYSNCGWWTNACAEHAFYDYFKYDTSLHYEQRNDWSGEALISDEEWAAMIDNDLANGRPMYYSGSDYSGGHAFVLDGSNLGGYYHFNWGWGGSYDGYYLLSNISPGSGGIGGNATYSFNLDQGAIFGIQPVPEQLDTVHVSLSLCWDNGVYEYKGYELPYKSVDTIVHYLDSVFVLHFEVENVNTVTYNSNTGGFGSNEDYDYCRVDGFTVRECNFTKNGKFFIGWGRKKSGAESRLFFPGEHIDTAGNVILYARWQDTAKAAIADVDEDGFLLWPNPTTDELNLQTATDGTVDVQVIDALGRVRISTTFASGKVKISLSSLPAGLYIVRLRTSDGVYNKRIIKR